MKYWRTIISRLLRSERGNVTILVGLGAFMMVTATGVAVDMARAQILQSKISTALDAAGLATGATANSVPAATNPATGKAWTTAQWVQSQAQRYFYANFPSGYLGAGTVNLDASLSSDETTVTLSATTTQATTILSAVGIKSVSVGANSQITRASKGMELVLVLDNTGSMANAVNSSDSSTSKISATQTASAELVNILFGTVNGPNPNLPTNLWIGLVPFSQAVNIGTGKTTWFTSPSAMDFGPTINSGSCPKYTLVSPNVSGSWSSSQQTCSYVLTGSNKPTNFGPTNWMGCVLSRSNSTKSAIDSAVTVNGSSMNVTMDISEDPPSGASTVFTPYDYPTASAGCSGWCGNSWFSSSNTGTSRSPTTTSIYSYPLDTADEGPNLFCPQQITAMTANETTILNGIDDMTVGGDTNINLGLAWGWRLLSPYWRQSGSFSGWSTEMNTSSLPLNYGTPLMNKVVILMTDGMNHYSPGNYTAYGYLSSSSAEAAAETALDNETLATCTALKNNGVLIYTIGFGNALPSGQTSPTSTQRSGTSGYVDDPLLQACATNANNGQKCSGSGPYCFLAPTNGQLQSAFYQIGDALANLRVSQ